MKFGQLLQASVSLDDQDFNLVLLYGPFWKLISLFVFLFLVCLLSFEKSVTFFLFF